MYYGVKISLRNVTNQRVSRLHDTETSHLSQFHYRPKLTRIQTVNLSDLHECSVLSSVTANLLLTDTISNCTRIRNHKLKAFLLLVCKICLVKLTIK